MTLCGVVLAAGWGTRLAPFSNDRPKASFPIGETNLLDRAIDTLRPFTDAIAVNYSPFAEWFRDHLPDEIEQFEEGPEPLGTAGALVNMRSWIDERDVVVLNVDSVLFGDVSAFLRLERDQPTQLLVTLDRIRPDFHGAWRFTGLSLMTNASLRQLPDTAHDLFRDLWKPQLSRGDAVLRPFAGIAIDCGTPVDLLAANLIASGGDPVIEDGAIVEGDIASSVVLRGGLVERDESIVNGIVGPGATFSLDDPA